MTRIASLLRNGLALLVLAAAAFAGCAEPAAPAAKPDTLLLHGCPDGGDLVIWFTVVDGELRPEGRCLAPGARPEEPVPGEGGLPTTDRMRPERDRPRESLPAEDRMRPDGDPDPLPEGLPVTDR